jgi:putative spermidine/putrescine transport system permease protein
VPLKEIALAQILSRSNHENSAWHAPCSVAERRSTDVFNRSINMAAIPVALRSGRVPGRRQRILHRFAPPVLLPAAQLLPSLFFLAIFFAVPAVVLISYSFLTQSARGIVGLPLTFAHYRHFFGNPLYAHVLWTTLRISLWTTAIAVLLAYPVALVMVRTGPLAARVITMIVIAPLIVSVVVRTYGWQVILGSGPNGVLNWILLSTGLVRTPVRLLYIEAAVVIGSLHVFFPMMVLLLASALGKIDPAIEDAARTLGATSWRCFRCITPPLSLPGLAVGCTLVFTLTAGSFVTPAILGGSAAQMLGMLVDQQILVVYDWPFGATVAAVLVAIVLTINLVSMRAFDRGKPVVAA